MELNFKNFDKKNIIVEGDKIFFVAHHLREFLSIPERSFTYLLSKVDAQHKDTRPSVGARKKMIVISIDGVRDLLARSRLKHVADVAELRKSFEEAFTAAATAEPIHNGSCIYLLEIADQTYKFGETDDLKRRLAEHKKAFDYRRVVHVFPCSNKTAARDAEQRVKEVMRQMRFLIKWPRRDDPSKNHIEVIKVDVPEHSIIDMIGTIVRKGQEAQRTTADSAAIDNLRREIDELKAKQSEHSSLLEHLIARQQVQDTRMLQMIEAQNAMLAHISTILSGPSKSKSRVR